MDCREFQKKLLGLNPKLKIIHGSGHIDGLYVKMPRHPKANPENGLKHLGGIPSSSFFSWIPKYDFWDDALGGYNRGWESVVRYLSQVVVDGYHTAINADEASRVFGSYAKRPRPLVKRKAEVWWAKKRTKEKYQLHNLPSNTMGQATVNV